MTGLCVEEIISHVDSTMKVLGWLLLVLYLGAVRSETNCTVCSAWVDRPVCGFNNRCYTSFKSSCEMEMMNCKLPDSYRFTEAPFYGHCFRSTIKKCKAYVLLEQLNKIDSSVEMFA
ncbi:uncharacterized protein LOC108115780 [Drosophila eugracilis]|uniref:uncharacterized protein LOC108115780 n=1 Tax=Drosophila eugracilis TaxID=29029 RepID=UPI0007E7D08D|nr:uncharacterized protein LOC108115780 [Drosophila eugracilis]